MKKKSLLVIWEQSVSVAFLFTLLVACQKTDRVTLNNNSVAEAKSWFSTNVLAGESRMLAKPFSELPETDPLRLLARMNRLSKKLDWSKAITGSAEKLEYIVVPLQKEEPLLKVGYFAKRAFVFYKYNNEPMQMQVVELLTKGEPASNPWQMATALFERKTTAKPLAGQTQDVQAFFYDKYYHTLDAYEIKNNQWKPMLASTLNKPGETQITAENDGGSDECREWGVYIITRDQYGNILNEQLIYTYWVGDCGGAGNGDNPNEEPGEWLGGGENANACAQAANDAQNAFIASFQTSNTPISSTTTDIDPITKTRTLKWKVMNGAATWNLQSTEKGVVKLISASEDRWQWESLEHVSLTKTGVAIGGEVEVTSHSGTASFTPGTQNVLYAGMSVDFTLKFIVTPIPCPPFDMVSPPIYKSYTANSIWNARP